MNELIKHKPEGSAIAIKDPESILRFAVEKGADVGVIERLMSVRRELRQEQAKEAFDSALAAFQAACPVIIKTKAVGERSGGVRYHYATLDSIVSQVKELLQQNGFSFSLDTKVESGWVEAICKVTHREGHSQLSNFKVPIDPKAFMNEQQKFASALTFAKRYAFVNAFGILTCDEDTDGQTKQPKPPGPSTLAAEPTVKEMAKELWDLLKPVRGAEKTWGSANQWLLDECVISDQEFVPDLSPERFRQVINKAREKLLK